MTSQGDRTPGDRRGAATPGAAKRGQDLAEGLVVRLVRAGLAASADGGATALSREGVVVARIEPAAGIALVDVNPRAGAGDAAALRRLGIPHPDSAKSAAGWRRQEVRTHRDADRVLQALKRPGVERLLPGREAAREGPVGVVHVRRVDEPRREGDGARVLVDADWPRGLARDQAAFDEWCPSVAPSPPLARAFGPAPARVRGFRRAYLSELRGGSKSADVSRLRALLRRGALTLLTAVRDVDESPAAVLAAAVARPHTPRG